MNSRPFFIANGFRRESLNDLLWLVLLVLVGIGALLFFTILTSTERPADVSSSMELLREFYDKGGTR